MWPGKRTEIQLTKLKKREKWKHSGLFSRTIRHKGTGSAAHMSGRHIRVRNAGTKKEGSLTGAQEQELHKVFGFVFRQIIIPKLQKPVLAVKKKQFCVSL